MFELTADNTIAYLKDQGHLAADESATATELGWGVSNIVLRIDRKAEPDWVLKQSRPQLRTDVPWFSRIDRIHREADVLRVLSGILPAGVVPEIVLEDRENYWFAMQAVAADHAVWKQQLLDGQADSDIARRLGDYLAVVHRETHLDPQLTESLIDQTVFEELRVDPFYRHLAEKFPDFRPPIEEMIAEMAANPLCLVLGDFSPKNILITGHKIVLVDFETGHRGDPAFDLGFFLSHLLLKTIYHVERFDDYAELTRSFWDAYFQGMRPLKHPTLQPGALLQRTFAHLAGCMWSRVDATSPVDYLTQETQQNLVRNFSRQLLLDPPTTWEKVLELLCDQ